MNYLWAGMIIVGIIFGAFNGKMPEVTNEALDSAKEAVTLCITMMGVMSVWVGMMEIATKAGVIELASKKMGPLLKLLFPGIPEGHPAREHIAVNFISNFLGLGWAATPAGLKAMEELAKLEEESGTAGYADESGRRVASNEMCTFLILNISSLQLIPVNMIAYRSQYGSVNPAGIIAPAIVATFVSTAAAVVYCKGKDRRRRI